MPGYEWLSKFGDGRDPGRVLVGHPGDAARPVARLLLDEPRRPGAEGVLRTCTRRTGRRTSRTCCSSCSRRSSPRSSRSDIVGEMTSIGTLFAFMLVCAGVWIMRVRRPELPRGFTVPALPVVAILGIVVCGAMIYGLGWTNWLRLIVLAGHRPGLLLRLRAAAQQAARRPEDAGSAWPQRCTGRRRAAFRLTTRAGCQRLLTGTAGRRCAGRPARAGHAAARSATC